MVYFITYTDLLNIQLYDIKTTCTIERKSSCPVPSETYLKGSVVILFIYLVTYYLQEGCDRTIRILSI